MHERGASPIPRTEESSDGMTELNIPSTGRAGQSTQIEQARAMAQVHAMMRMAKEFPRDPGLAWTRMEDACSHMELAERAFYRFPKGGKQVTGPTVHLARELALCWGNIDFGVSELARDDYKLESEMLAQAWDIEVNARTYMGFILPHKKDVGGGTQPIYTMREIYESNANAGARRLRECIYAVLPLRFCLDAQKLCRRTLEEENSAVPFRERVEQLVHWYAGKGVKQDQLADKIGKPIGHWSSGDLATLRIISHSLHANETTIELEFPTVFTRAEDVVGPQLGVTGAQAMANAEQGAAEIRQAVQAKQWQPEQPAAPAAPPPGYVCEICASANDDQEFPPHFQDECPRINAPGQ